MRTPYGPSRCESLGETSRDRGCHRGGAMEERSALLARLTRVLAVTAPQAPLADRLCRAFAEILGVHGAAITVGFSTPDRTTLCASDDVATQLEEMQDVLREGPGLDAFRPAAPGLHSRAAQAGLWPMLHQAMSEDLAGVSLLAFPMHPDSEVLGAISLYSRSEHALLCSVDEAQFLADAIGVAILGRFDRAESTDVVWSTRDRINQATGMVVAQLGIRSPDALAVLRAHAYAQGLSLETVAQAVVARELDFKAIDEREG